MITSPVNVSQSPVAITRYLDGAWARTRDIVATEEPLEIRVATAADPAGEAITVTMRTPGRDAELAAGLLFAEGIVQHARDIASIDPAPESGWPGHESQGVVVRLRPGLVVDLERQRRNFTTTSACGVCGKAALDALTMEGARPLTTGATVEAAILTQLPATLRAAQEGFDATGGVHACGLFDASGALLTLQEDVGRHNAFDKLIGAHLLAGATDTLTQRIVLLSGRASFELLQKALAARIPIVAAVGAPSSLAVEIAELFNITLVGFLRGGAFNVYAGRERLR